MGYATRFNDPTWSKNKNGPRLQRFVSTGTPGEYEAVFRNFDLSKEYGRATFTMEFLKYSEAPPNVAKEIIARNG